MCPRLIRSATLLTRSQPLSDGGLLEPLPPPWCGFPRIAVARIGERKSMKSDHRNDAGLCVFAIGYHRLPNLQHRPNNPHIAAHTTEPTGRKYLANLCTIALTSIIINSFSPHNSPLPQSPPPSNSESLKHITTPHPRPHATRLPDLTLTCTMPLSHPTRRLALTEMTRAHPNATAMSLPTKTRSRLTNDKMMASKIKQDKKYIQKVTDTWEYVLRKEMDLSHGWIASLEVLVGRRTQALCPVGTCSESHTIPTGNVHKCIFYLPQPIGPASVH